MIIKLTTAGKNETIYVNFDYVRSFRRDGTFTELVMSDDRYHKMAVSETPTEIYDILYNTKTCSCTCQCGNNTPEAGVAEPAPAAFASGVAESATKKPATKKTAAKTE